LINLLSILPIFVLFHIFSKPSYGLFYLSCNAGNRDECTANNCSSKSSSSYACNSIASRTNGCTLNRVNHGCFYCTRQVVKKYKTCDKSGSSLSEFSKVCLNWAWRLIRNEKNKLLSLRETAMHVTEKSEAISFERRCRSSRLTGWWIQKE
jgi:hypothetical protein